MIVVVRKRRLRYVNGITVLRFKTQTCMMHRLNFRQWLKYQFIIHMVIDYCRLCTPELDKIVVIELYFNHLVPIPLCSYNLEIENVKHVFFRCLKYVNEHTILFRETRNYHPLNLNMALFGDIIASLESNPPFSENSMDFRVLYMEIRGCP